VFQKEKPAIEKELNLAESGLDSKLLI